MIDKETLIGLLEETLAHWDENVETFKGLGKEDSQDVWFGVNCYADDCELCLYRRSNSIESCADFCPLDDDMTNDNGNHQDGTCCIEWGNLLEKLR